MDTDQNSGYREHAHTADWELDAWAPDLPALFEQVARGMYSLAGIQLQACPRTRQTIHLSADDPETLLVSFLSELIYLIESQGLCFDTFNFKFEGTQLWAFLEGAHQAKQDKEIKAVTYHNLSIQPTAHGLTVRVVFDV